MSKRLNHISPQSKTEAYERVEAILESGPFVPGSRAVHRAHFLYALRWSQVGARISEMNDLGWQIAGVTLPERQWENGIRTAYRLDGKPLQSESPGDWHEDQFRNPLPHATGDLPLFASVRS